MTDLADVALIHGPAASVLREAVSRRSVDMVYMDPPFFTQRDWTGEAGSFSDRWAWDDAARARLASLHLSAPGIAPILDAICGNRLPFLSYLLAMRDLIAAAHSRLKSTGSFWLHCDDTAGSHLRIVCDTVFGPTRFWGSVIWKRSSGTGSALARGYWRNKDTIFAYVRTGAALARLAGQGLHHRNTRPIDVDGVRGRMLDAYANDELGSSSKERVGYPTQKPVSLLRRLIETGSCAGDLVVDPCCGSGTTIVAARELGRNAIGIDQSADAILVAKRRTATVHHQLEMF